MRVFFGIWIEPWLLQILSWILNVHRETNVTFYGVTEANVPAGKWPF